MALVTFGEYVTQIAHCVFAVSQVSDAEMSASAAVAQKMLSSDDETEHLRNHLQPKPVDRLDSLSKKKVKRTILHLERWWGAHLPFYGREPIGG